MMVRGDAIPIRNGSLYNAYEAGRFISTGFAQGIKNAKIFSCPLKDLFAFAYSLAEDIRSF